MLDIQCDFDNHLTLHTYIAIVVLTLLYICAHHFIHHWTNKRTNGYVCVSTHYCLFKLTCHVQFDVVLFNSISNFKIFITHLNYKCFSKLQSMFKNVFLRLVECVGKMNVVNSKFKTKGVWKLSKQNERHA